MIFRLVRAMAPVFGGLLLAGLLATPPASAADKAASMVIDANTGKVLHDRAGSELRHPASLTKMMTLYLAFETIEAGRLGFGTALTVSERAADAAPSKIGLKAGDQIKLRDAMKALVVKSANDMAIAIAEKIAGSEEAFASLMTKRARQIGMQRTVFRNASGLPDSEQVTTARDILTLAMRLQDDFPQHYAMFSLRTFSYGGKTYRSHNALLGRFAGVDGIKTGYTRASGFNLVSSYQKGGKHVVAAVFGGASASVRDAYMRMLLAQAIPNASTARTRKSGPQLIAEARPAKRPTAPAKQATPKPAPVMTAEAPAPLQIAPPPLEATGGGATISIARVRTVSVLPDVAPASAGAGGGEDNGPTTAAAADPAPAPKFDFDALKARLSEAQQEAVVAAYEPETAANPAQAPDATEPLRIGETIVAKLDGDVRPGRPPSTLNAQMASLSAAPSFLGGARQPEPPPYAAVPVARAGQAAFDIQVGVYSSPGEAQRMLDAARDRAAGLLDNHAAMALPLRKGERQLYRARFAGFDQQQASSVCLELRRMSLDCFVAASN